MDSDNVWDSNERGKQFEVCKDSTKVWDREGRDKQKVGWTLTMYGTEKGEISRRSVGLCQSM